MPAWGADASHGKFGNDPALSAAEKQTLVDWADAKAPAGKAKDAPAAVKFIEGWNIGQMYEIPTSGTLEYTRYTLPLNFKEDRWVAAAEIRPGNRTVVHHVIAYLREPGSKWLEGAPAGEPIVKIKASDGGPRSQLVGYAPGVPARPETPGRAILVKAGSDVVLEMHYTPNGKAAADLTKAGIIFAKEPPVERLAGFSAGNHRVVIPPGDGAYEVRAAMKMPREARLVNLTPHMHLRRKDFEYIAKYPAGEKEVLLRVPRYDFNWQHTYELAEPKVLPAGTVIECIAHFDNSPDNAANPDAKAEVRWGDQSWEEMMIGFGALAVDAK